MFKLYKMDKLLQIKLITKGLLLNSMSLNSMPNFRTGLESNLSSNHLEKFLKLIVISTLPISWLPITR
jgi:hypothetical protein